MERLPEPYKMCVTLHLIQKRKIHPEDFKEYGKKLTAFAEYCADFGMPISFHHHMGTAIETEEELDLLMNHTGEAVYLLFDTGHMTFAGGKFD